MVDASDRWNKHMENLQNKDKEIKELIHPNGKIEINDPEIGINISLKGSIKDYSYSSGIFNFEGEVKNIYINGIKVPLEVPINKGNINIVELYKMFLEGKYRD